MRESLTIHYSALQFILTNLQDLFIGGSLRNIFCNEQKKHALRVFYKGSCPLICYKPSNKLKKIEKTLQKSFLAKLQNSSRHFY